MLALITISASLVVGASQECYEGVLGEAARARRVVVERAEGRTATAHIYGRPARSVVLAEHNHAAAASSARQYQSEDGATNFVILSDSARIETPMAGLVIAATLRRTKTAVSADVTGEWNAAIGPGGVIRLITRVQSGPCGLYVGSIDSPDQGQTGLPLTSVQVAEDTLVIEAAYMGLRIALPLSGSDERRAVMDQNGVRSEIVMRRGTSESALRRPQEPQSPYPYQQQEVVFQSRAKGIRLGGSLTLPTGPGPHPAVVFISGSGAQDRDETIAGHKPFLVLGDHLTRLGYAVLRTDDRGVGASTGNVLHSDLWDIADDVRAGIDYLRSLPEIDAARIGLLGHSEGGYVAPLVAASDDQVAFVLLLGAPAVGGRELMLAQRAALTRGSGAPPEHVRLDSMMLAEIFAVLAERPSDDRIAATVDSALSAWLLRLRGEERSHVSSQLRARTAAADSQSADLWRSKWFKGLFHYDPGVYLQKMTVPLFALIGELDLQVPAAQSVERFRTLYRGPRQRLLSLHTPSRINHMLQPASTGRMDEYMAIDVTIAPVVLQLMEEWLGRTMPVRRASH